MSTLGAFGHVRVATDDHAEAGFHFTLPAFVFGILTDWDERYFLSHNRWQEQVAELVDCSSFVVIDLRQIGKGLREELGIVSERIEPERMLPIVATASAWKELGGEHFPCSPLILEGDRGRLAVELTQRFRAIHREEVRRK